MAIFCTYCGRGFARNEHLQRHVLTHTKLRPFECPVCHVTFTRGDLLKKHFVAHDANDPALSSITASSELVQQLATKSRGAAACTNCARTKTKCDTKQPCHRCQAKGLTCVPRTPRPRGPRPGQPRRASLQASPGSAADEDNSPGQHLPHATVGNMQIDGMDMTKTNSTDEQFGMASGSIPDTHTSMISLEHIPADYSRQLLPPETMGHFMTLDGGGVAAQGNSATTHQDGTSTLQDGSNILHETSDWPILFSPSWHFGTTPSAEAWNSPPGAEVFGTFLGAAIPDPFRTVQQNDGSIPVEDGTQDLEHEELVQEPPAQQHHDMRRDPQGTGSGSKANGTSPVSTGDTPASTATSPLFLEDANITRDDEDPWRLPKDVEHWTMLQCCPTPRGVRVAPGRAKADLAFLEESPKVAGRWSSGAPSFIERGPAGKTPSPPRITLSPYTREKMSAISQSFFQKALETHGLGVTSSLTAHRVGSGIATDSFGSSGFVLLPPTEHLQLFLETYLSFVEPHYPLVPARSLDPNELLSNSYNDKGASLLLLLMIALGATVDPATKARRLAAGLVEMCRIALTDLIEKDNGYSTVPLILQCSLLLTIQSCWGGEKWQMDIGTGHRSIYISMLNNSGFLRKAEAKRPEVPLEEDIQSSWRIWVEKEGRRRLAYDWVMIDQELCLFHDQPTKFGIAELKAPVPEAEDLWLARNALEWRDHIVTTASASSEQPSPDPQQADVAKLLSERPSYSLYMLFQLLLDDELDHATFRLTPLTMRLLLYPLQTLVHNHCQLLESFSYRAWSTSASSPSKTTTRTSSILRLEEIHVLLERWWRLADSHLDGSLLTQQQPAGTASGLLFHVISLNLYTAFKEMETFARGERPGWFSSPSPAADAPNRWIHAPHEALYHSGQILRLIRQTSVPERPMWWAAALYRAAIVMWVYGMTTQFRARARPGSTQQRGPEGAAAGDGDVVPDAAAPVVLLDALVPGTPEAVRFLRHKRGEPRLGGAGPEAAAVPLRNPQPVLKACIGLLHEGGDACTWFSTGVRLKLEALLRAWSTERA